MRRWLALSALFLITSCAVPFLVDDDDGRCCTAPSEAGSGH